MFFRATEKSEGAGLGLYIVKEMTKKLGGTIQVTSVLGEGTSFQLEIPNAYQPEKQANFNCKDDAHASMSFIPSFSSQRCT